MTASAPAAPSIWADFLEIFIAPTEVFERRKADPKFGLAFLVLLGLFVVCYFATRAALEPLMDAEFERSMAQVRAQNPQLTDEQMQASRAIGRNFAMIGMLVFAVVGPLLTGVVLWLVGKFVDSKADITGAVMVSVYSYFPRALGLLVGGIIAFLLPEDRKDSIMRASLGLGAIMDPDTTSPILRAFAARIELFQIWQVVLLALGLSIVGRVSRTQGFIAAVLVWLIGGLPGLLGALRQ